MITKHRSLFINNDDHVDVHPQFVAGVIHHVYRGSFGAQSGLSRGSFGAHSGLITQLKFHSFTTEPRPNRCGNIPGAREQTRISFNRRGIAMLLDGIAI